MSAADVRDELRAGIGERYGDQLIRHRWINARALARRTRTSPRLKEHLGHLIAELERQAAAQGVKLNRRNWRAYVDRDEGLVFGIMLTGDDLEFVEPKRQEKRKRKPIPKPEHGKDGGQLLDDVESQLEASLAALAK